MSDDPWPTIPLYVAGVNPVMTAVAGEVADGFAAHMFCTPTYLDRILRPALARGAARANRSAPPVLMPLVVGRDRASLALQMTTYTVPAYRRVLDEGLLRAGTTVHVAARRLWIRIGAPSNLDARLNGRALRGLPTDTGNVFVTAAGLEPA